MKRWRLYLPILAAALAICGWVWAQPVIQQTYTGNEVWNCGQGPGGPSGGFCSLNGARNSTGYVVVNVAATTAAQLSQGVNDILLTASPTSGGNFITPVAPIDGQFLTLCNVTTSAFGTLSGGITLSPNQNFFSGGTVASFNSLAANSCFEIQFQLSGGQPLSGGTWYRLR